MIKKYSQSDNNLDSFVALLQIHRARIGFSPDVCHVYVKFCNYDSLISAMAGSYFPLEQSFGVLNERWERPSTLEQFLLICYKCFQVKKEVKFLWQCTVYAILSITWLEENT